MESYIPWEGRGQVGREAGALLFLFSHSCGPATIGIYVTCTYFLDVSAHHFHVVYLGEAPDEEVDGNEGGGVRVVLAGGSDPGVVHGGAHHRVQDLLLLLPGHRTH